MEKKNRGMIFVYWVLILFFVVFTFYKCSCHDVKETLKCNKSKAESEKHKDIGDYVYIDFRGILHTKNGCQAVYKDHGAQPVSVTCVKDMDEIDFSKICSQCVTDMQLTELEEIHDKAYTKRNQRKLYNDLKDIYDDLGSFKRFNNYLQDSVKRQKLYYALIKNGYDFSVLEDYEQDYVSFEKCIYKRIQ